MSDAQRFLLTIDSDPVEAQAIARETAQKIEEKQITLVQVAETLGPYLTEEDATLRSKAVAYFAAFLAALDPKTLTRQQITANVQFFCDKIQDASGLKEATTGLISLGACQKFNTEHAVQITKALFTDAQDLQRHPQSTRFTVLSLFDRLLADYRAALRAMGSEFIVGFTDLISGEKDPRNLMIVFSLLRVILVEWDISDHVHTLFDSVYCYFPITFRPPPDDPYGITAQDLKDRLRECISATSLFAGVAFPAFLDKIDSASLNVKRDVLQALRACAASYDPSVISSHCIQLWDSLKFEIFNASDDELADEALLLFKTLAETLSKSNSHATLTQYLKPLLAECNDLLKEPQQKQASQVGQILSSVGSASPTAFSLVIKSVLPPLLTLYDDYGSIGRQRALLSILNHVLDAALSIYGARGSSDTPALENPLDHFKDRLFQKYGQALMAAPKNEVSFRAVALEGLTRLCKIQKYLAREEIGLFVQYLDEILLIEEDNGENELKEAAITSLVEISRFHADLIVDVTFPAFMAKLPDSTESDDDNSYFRSLEGLARISVERRILELLVRRLHNRLDIALVQSRSPNYPHAILSTLIYAFNNCKLEEDSNLQAYYDRIVTGSLVKTVLPSTKSEAQHQAIDDTILDTFGQLTNILVRHLSSEKQEEVSQQVLKPLLGSWILKGDRAMSLKERQASTIIPSYILAAFRRDVSLPVDTSASLESLVTQAIREPDPATRFASSRSISLIVNKHLPQNSPLASSLSNGIFESLEATFRSPENPTQAPVEVRNQLQIVLWIAKALIFRADKSTFPILDRLLDLLGNEKIGSILAQGFTILLSSDELVSSTNYAIIRLLYKQRCFDYCLPKLSTSFRAAEGPVKPNYLVALSGLLKWTPSSVVMQQLDSILPLLLQSMDLSDSAVKAATIDTLTATVRESPKAVEAHLSSLITRLLVNTSQEESSASPRIRVLALQCLQIFPQAIRQELLLPFKKQVIRRLLETLDDPKRNVRKESVDCRAAWFRMDEPTDDDD